MCVQLGAWEAKSQGAGLPGPVTSSRKGACGGGQDLSTGRAQTGAGSGPLKRRRRNIAGNKIMFLYPLTLRFSGEDIPPHRPWLPWAEADPGSAPYPPPNRFTGNLDGPRTPISGSKQQQHSFSLPLSGLRSASGQCFQTHFILETLEPTQTELYYQHWDPPSNPNS